MPQLQDLKNLPQRLSGNPMMNLATSKSGQKYLATGCLGCIGLIMMLGVGILSGGNIANRTREAPSGRQTAGGGSSFSDDCLNINLSDPLLRTIIATINNYQRENGIIDTYKTAAQRGDVPWELLAAVHYREARNQPDGRLKDGKALGGQTLLESALEAAAHLKNSAKSAGKILTQSTTDKDTIGEALFGYNGRASAYIKQARDRGFAHDYEGSPYVMNRFDAAHTDLKIITRDHGPADDIDTRYGAYPVFLALKKIGHTCGQSSTGPSNPNQKTALPINLNEIRGLNASLHGLTISRPSSANGHNAILGPKGSYGTRASGLGEAVDLATKSPGGAQVFAPFSGTIVYASSDRALGDTGGFIIIESEDKRLITALAHLQNYKKSGKVNVGEVIGEVKAYACSNCLGPHLHFELWFDGRVINAGTDATPTKIWEAQKRFLQS